MIRWILFNPISLPKNRFLGCFSSCVFSLVGEPLMRIFNLIKSAYKDTARMAKIINLPNITIIPGFRSTLLQHGYTAIPMMIFLLFIIVYPTTCRARFLIKLTLISFLGLITNYYPLPICQTLGYSRFRSFSYRRGVKWISVSMKLILQR